MRRLAIAIAFVAGLLPALAAAQAPPPVPALPDSERRTSYTITASNCACSVGFGIYGDSNDVDAWIEVWLNGARFLSTDPTFGWSLSSASGTLATIARPITNAVLTFNNVQTGTVQIVGARRPRRTLQFQENRGVAARDINQAVTDVVAQNRETWDKINDVSGRALIFSPGNTAGLIPNPPGCANSTLAFDGSGLNPVCLPQPTGVGLSINGNQTFLAPGAVTGVVLTSAPLPTASNSLFVYVDGIYRDPTTYTYNAVSGAITFNTALPANTQFVSAKWVSTASFGSVTSLNSLGGAINLLATKPLTVTPSGQNLTVAFQSGNPIWASQFGLADWCANLVAALAQLGTNAGKVVVDTNAGPSACSAAGTILLGDNHTVEFVGSGEFVLNQTIQFGRNNQMFSVGGGVGPGPPTAITGVRLKWTGTTTTAMVKFFDAQKSRLHDIGLNCNGTSGGIGLWMDSDNNPTTSQNMLENLSFTGCHISAIFGSQATTGISQGSCAITPSQDGCSENDFLTFTNFQIYGAVGDLTAVGIHVNSQNALQNSLVSIGDIQGVNIGVHIINGAGQTSNFNRITSGSVVGASPVLFLTEVSNLAGGPNLTNNDAEGALTNAVIDHSGGGIATWNGNNFTQPIIVDSAATIISIGNTMTAGNCTASGNARIFEFGDLNSCWVVGTGTPILYGIWQSWTPTVTCGAGAFGTLGTVTATFMRTSAGSRSGTGTIYYTMSIPATGNSSTCNPINFTLPVANPLVDSIGSGQETQGTNKSLVSHISSSANNGAITQYDNGAPMSGGAAATVVVSGFYRTTTPP